MARIPLVPVSFDVDGTPVTGKIIFNGYSPAIRTVTGDLKSCVNVITDRFGKGSPMVMMDIDGISGRDMDPRVLKKLRTKRLNALVMTGVVELDDLFDAFYTGIDGLAAPYHTVSSDAVLEEMNGLSDKVVPVVFTDGRNAATSKGQENIIISLRKLGSFGFGRIGVIDVSGKFDSGMWADVFREFNAVIPFVYDQTDGTERMLEDIGFMDIFIEFS